jgi:hypothetical protein
VKAYKFLREGRVGPFTGFRWEPGEWVETSGPALCDRGVHACRTRDLPFWINTELWEIELDGEVAEGERKLVAERGRLVRRVEGWDTDAAQALADSCAARARAFADANPDDPMIAAYAADCEQRASQGRVPVITYIAAVAAEQAGGPEGRDAERGAQADWFAQLL